MQAQTGSSASRVPAIVAIVGGAILAIGSFLTWASVSVDTDVLIQKLASALGLDPSLLQGQVPTSGFNQSVNGFDAGADGKITLVMGIIVLAAAVVMIVKPDIKKAMGVVAILAALVGGGIAVYDVAQVNDVANQAEDAASAIAGPQLQQAGVGPDVFEGIFDVSAGIGLWACIAGGVIGLVGGVLALRGGPSTASVGMGTSTASTTPTTGTGFETSAAPVAPGAPVAPTPQAPPVAPTPQAPPPAAPPTPPPTPEPASQPQPVEETTQTPESSGERPDDPGSGDAPSTG
jgi:hypothetical protein